MDWLPSVPTEQVLANFSRAVYPSMRFTANAINPNLIFYPIAYNLQLSPNQHSFVQCIHPATSIATALANFFPLQQGTPEQRGIELMANYWLRETWNLHADFREDPMLYCYYSIFRDGQELTWDGFVDYRLQEKLMWLRYEQIPYIGFKIEIV